MTLWFACLIHQNSNTYWLLMLVVGVWSNLFRILFIISRWNVLFSGVSLKWRNYQNNLKNIRKRCHKVQTISNSNTWPRLIYGDEFSAPYSKQKAFFHSNSCSKRKIVSLPKTSRTRNFSNENFKVLFAAHLEGKQLWRDEVYEKPHMKLFVLLIENSFKGNSIYLENYYSIHKTRASSSRDELSLQNNDLHTIFYLWKYYTGWFCFDNRREIRMRERQVRQWVERNFIDRNDQ